MSVLDRKGWEETKTADSITIRVESMWEPTFEVDGIEWSHTICQVKHLICQEIKRKGLNFCLPEKKLLGFNGRLLLDEDKSLGSIFEHDADAANIQLPITVALLPSLLRVVGDRYDDDDDDEEEEEDEEEEDDSFGKTHTICCVQRPQTYAQLPFSIVNELGVIGNLEMHSSSGKRIDHVSGFMYAESIKTSAKVVLLALNHRIWEELSFFVGKSDARMSRYLILHVSWDELSFLFLRSLRSFYPRLPIVAVTDMDPNHLHILNFLDTPPHVIADSYRKESEKDAKDAEIFFENCRNASVTNVDYVNIKWLGLRPSDCEHLAPADTSMSLPDDFGWVIHQLSADPFFRRKKEWVKQMKRLRLFGKRMLLDSAAVVDVDNFLSNKLAKRDWI